MPAGGIDLLSVGHYLVIAGVPGALRLASGSSLVPKVAYGLADASRAAFSPW